jgi:hypothetical protein
MYGIVAIPLDRAEFTRLEAARAAVERAEMLEMRTNHN